MMREFLGVLGILLLAAPIVPQEWQEGGFVPTKLSPTPLIDGTSHARSGGDDDSILSKYGDFPELLEQDLPLGIHTPTGPQDDAEGSGSGGASTLAPGSEGVSDVPKPPPARIPFSATPLNISYKSKDDFAPRGMEHLYLITNTFLQVVHRDEEMPTELSALVQREVDSPTLDNEQAARITKDLEANWDVFIFHYVGLTCLVVLGLLLGIITPVAGLIFACCRCGGRCGGDYPTYDKKSDPCKRVVLGIILASFIVILLLGLVCSFVTNARMETGIQSFPSKLETGVRDTRLYFNNTHKEVQNLFETNFKELQRVLFNKLDRSGELINGELARVSKAIAIDNLTAIATSLSAIKKDLHIIRNITVQLQDETNYLQNGLRDVATRLRELKDGCESIPECLNLITKYAGNLEIKNEFNAYLESDVLPQLPDVKNKLQEVSRLIDNDIEIEVKRGKRAFDSIAREIQSKVQNSIPEIKQQIRNTGYELKQFPKEVSRIFEDLDIDRAYEHIDTSRHYISEYAMYRYWYFFMVCFLLLLITLCFTMGIIFGCCGRRPDEATSCYKNTGASWLMWGVGLTFLFSIIIMLTTTVLFLVGSIGELLICDPLRDPSHSEVFALASKQLRLEKYFSNEQPPELTEVIRKCHNNESIYVVLELHTYYSNLQNLSNYKNFFKLDEKIDKIRYDIGSSIDTNVQILSKEAKMQLWDLANSTFAHKGSWDYYTGILEQDVLTIDLLELAAQLNQTADELPPDYGTISVKLKNDAIYLEGLRRWLSSIKTNIRTLKETTTRLSESLKFNKTSLNVAIQDLIREAEFAQSYLKSNGSTEVANLVSRFSDDFLADVDSYVAHVKKSMLHDVGKCGPMSTVYNSTTSALCKNILYPFNGFWSSVGWCFLFFIPCMALAVQLASLYRKTEPYSGPLTESEYLYDAYDERNSRHYLNHESMYDAFAERDNIPLTSGCDKKQRRRSREYDCPRVAGSYAAEPYAPPHASPPRADYPPPTNDWAEYPSSGGPPRYTSQPSLSPEYERPPPYYFPGPGAQYYGGPPSGPSSGALQVHPPPSGLMPSGGQQSWNTAQRFNTGGWKISPAYSRDDFDA